MSKEWIIDVLGDLRGFARTNGMPTLAEQLEETLTVAMAELAQVPAGQAERNASETGRHAGAAGPGR